MSTIIYPSPIFGPIHSRRLGISLGINLLPAEGKWCSFDCLYCECGFNADHKPYNPLPTAEEVCEKLKGKLEEMKQEGVVPDVLTFAGNGEPTLHPKFPDIVDGVIAIRDQYCPKAKVSVLSNATQIGKAEIREALMKVDNPILKLDTVNSTYINMVDRPQGKYDVREQILHLSEMEGSAIIQTMFMCGCVDGISVDNTSEEFISPYIEALKQIKPRQVMIYTLDRETPAQGLEKASKECMDSIADRLRKEGFQVSVSY